MEICHQNLSPYRSVCDDLYHTCTFAWGDTFRSFYSVLEDATTLKLAPFCSFQTGLLIDILFAKFWRDRRLAKILKKPKAIVQGFFLGVRQKVLRNVIHLKVNEKRS